MCRELRWESKQRTQRRTDSYQRSTPALLDSRGREEMSGKGDRRENEGKFHPRFSSEKVAFPGIDALSNDSKLNMPGKLPVCSLELTSRLTIKLLPFFPLLLTCRTNLQPPFHNLAQIHSLRNKWPSSLNEEVTVSHAGEFFVPEVRALHSHVKAES